MDKDLLLFLMPPDRQRPDRGPRNSLRQTAARALSTTQASEKQVGRITYRPPKIECVYLVGKTFLSWKIAEGQDVPNKIREDHANTSIRQPN
ncbi:hypothetical protein TNCV_4704091 [Trichonephila clavipes]|nr:hypothetical protein TNCV_4704091 [Trichonephila clavipes]